MRHYAASPPPYPIDPEDLWQACDDPNAAAWDKSTQLTPAQRAGYEKGIADAVSSEKLNPALEQSAQLVSTACTNINTVFATLNAKLTSAKFAPRLAEIQMEYLDVLWESHDLALDISYYAERFEDIIIPMCANKKYSINQRKKKLVQFIRTADAFVTTSQLICERFKGREGLTAKFGAFVRDLKHGKGMKSSKELAKINPVLDAPLPVVVAPPVIIGAIARRVGATIVGAGALSIIVGIIELAVYLGIYLRKSKLEREEEDLFRPFTDNINQLAMVWTAARTDALQIKKWLQAGAQDADMPECMMTSIGKATHVYRAMSLYLRGYADGIASSNETPPPMV